MTKFSPTALPGHALHDEGRAYDGVQRLKVGAARCACGATSDDLPSDNARRRWHHDHKDAIRRTAERTQP